MENKKAILGLISMQLAMMGNTMYPHEGNPVSFNPNNIKRPFPIIPKDLKRFNIDGKEVWALNLKNAIRKSKKIKENQNGS